jgi:hypothetical protein
MRVSLHGYGSPPLLDGFGRTKKQDATENRSPYARHVRASGFPLPSIANAPEFVRAMKKVPATPR